MPVIPEFDQALAIPQPAQLRGADPAAFEAPGAALARGGAQVSNELFSFAQRYSDARRMTDAAAATNDIQKQQQDLAFQASKIPDHNQALDFFRQGVAKIQQSVLANISDPLVQSYVQRATGDHATALEPSVRHESFAAEANRNIADLQERMITARNMMATAPNDLVRAQVGDQAFADIAGHVAAGYLKPEDGEAMKQRFRSGAAEDSALRLIRADPQRAMDVLNNPAETQRVLPGLDPVAADRLTWRAARAIDASNRHTALAAASATIASAGSPWIAPPATDDDVWNRQIQTESNGRQTNQDGTPYTSDKGAVGIAQIMPDTAQETAAKHGITWDQNKYQTNAKYNETLGRAYMNDMLARYDGNRTLALAAYNAGPDRVDQWLGTNGDPRKGGMSDADWAARIPIAETRGYVAKIMGNGQPDLAAQVEDVRRRTAGMPLDMQEHATALVVENFHQQQAGQAAARAELGRRVQDLQTGFQNGLTGTAIPEDEIRSVYPPADANRLIENLRITRSAGDLFRSVQWAAPADEQAARAALAVPGSLSAKTPLQEGHAWLPAALPGQPGTETPDGLKLRLQVAKEYEQMLAGKWKALREDPAGYVASNPTVQQAIQAMDPAKPDTVEAYVRATKAVQAQLGVPDADQHVLAASQAAAIATKLKQADPTKTDAGAQLDQVAQSYGAAWPDVYRDLVTLGKLPREYQVLAIMDRPEQAGARIDMQRALVAATQRGGMAKLAEDLPTGARQTIDQGIDGEIDDFRRTASIPGVSANIEQIAAIRDSVKQLAYFYAIQGRSGATAVTDAAAAVLGRYDFDGTLRTPKGMMAQAQASLASVQSKLSDADLADPGARPNDPAASLTPDQRRSIYLKAAQRGTWIANPRDDGAWLVAQLRNGENTVVRRANGAPIEVKWNALPAAPAAAPATAPGDESNFVRPTVE